MPGCVRGVATAPARRDALPRNAPLRPTAPVGPKPARRTDCARTTEPGAPRRWTRGPDQLGTFGSSKPAAASAPCATPRPGLATRARPALTPTISGPEGPSTVHARPEHAQALAPWGEPHRARRRWPREPQRCCADSAKPKPRDARRATSRIDGGCARPLWNPHDSVMPCPAAADTHRPFVPTTRVNGVATESPRSGWKCPGLLPVSPQEAPTAAQRRTAEPARAVVRVRSTTEAASLPRAPRERVRRPPTRCFHRCSSARRLAKPTHPILRTDRADVAADSTSSPDPRFVAVSEPRCQLVPIPPRRSKLQRGGGRHEPKLALTFETWPREEPSSGARTSSNTVSPPYDCETSDETPGLVIHRAGEPLRRAARPRLRCSARSCPGATRRCCHRQAPTERHGSEDPR